MNPNLQLIREKCIAANGEIADSKNCPYACQEGHIPFGDAEVIGGCPLHVKPFGHYEPYRLIRLADVLLAIETLLNGETWKTGKHAASFETISLKVIGLWDFRADDFEKQSKETINFLEELFK